MALAQFPAPGESELATIVLVMTHPPDQCPAANSTIRKLSANTASEFPKLAKKHGIRFTAGPLATNEHRMFAFVEAEKIESINDFLIDSALLQWNSIEMIPGQPVESGLKEIEKLKPIY